MILHTKGKNKDEKKVDIVSFNSNRKPDGKGTV